jgi:hypothetical protein
VPESFSKIYYLSYIKNVLLSRTSTILCNVELARSTQHQSLGNPDSASVSLLGWRCLDAQPTRGSAESFAPGLILHNDLRFGSFFLSYSRILRQIEHNVNESR